MDNGGTPDLNRELLQLMRESNAKTAEVVTAIGDLTTTVADLVVDRDTRRRRDRWAAVTAGAVILGILGAGGVSYSNSRVIATLEDCTHPGGECYAESQRRTAGIVGPIGEKLDRIEQRGNDSRRLLCAGVDPSTPPPPVDLCPPSATSSTTTR